MGICISPLDRENKTIFYTSAPQYLAKNFEVNLENEYQIKAAQSLEESTSWNGYKVDVSIWTKGNPNLVILQKRILEAFQNTLVGYTIESYYRSSDFKTLLGLSTYVNENTAQTANSQPVPYKIANAVQKLPQILRAGAERMNPVIQYVSVATDLGIPLIVHGVNNTILAKDEQACFFRVIGESVYIIESEDGQENECDCHIMIGSTDQITSSTNDKSSLTATESSPRVIQSEPEIDRNISTVRSINELKSISSLRSNHDLMMFPGDFFPSFAPYQRRSSFFTITVFNDTLSVATYKSNILTSWKRVEAEKLFLKIIKMLMMAKLRQQFNLKLDLVYSKLNNAKEEGHLFHQTLDLIGQISGLISEEIQQQILDYLQSIFVARVAGAQIESNRQLIIDMTELSVQEMAEILQSLVLCQNISTPIVFSNCCHSKNPAFSNLHLHNLDRSQLLGAIQKLTELPATPSAPQSMHRQVWYKKMLDAFLDSFAIYLESNGMKRESNNKVVNENSGHFVMSDQEFFSVPPIFFQKDGRKRFLIIQCGFKSFFAYINIMMLKKKTGTSNCAEISEEDYLRIARKTNIIAFSFDFHLRYLQDSVFSPDLPFNILMVLRNFSDLHPIRPSTARNRIIHGTYIDPEQRSMEKIINYIANNCKDYGFNPINSGLDLLGFGVTTNTLSKKKTKTNSRLEFTLICTINVQWEGVTSFEEKVEYFIIVVDYENRFPSPESKENVSEIKSYVSDPLREYIGEGYYIGDVVKYFDKKIRYSIQEV